MNSLNENIRPYQSCSKSVFLILGIIFISWISLFSIFLIVQGAWPVSIFLGLEYLIIFYLIRLYFKEKNIKDEININQKEISIRESDKETEIAPFLHADIKEGLYLRIKKQLSSW